MIKIPATAADIRAIPTVLAEGVDVDVTLIFSVRRYRQVPSAYLAGLEGALERRGGCRDYLDTMYVEELVGPGTVNMMPERTLRAFADHGELHDVPGGDAVTGRGAEAEGVFTAIAAAGVDPPGAFSALEHDGIERSTSWASLHSAVACATAPW